jgi:hypothetical protein
VGERQVVKDARELVVGETQELARLGVELKLDVGSAARERGEQRATHRVAAEKGSARAHPGGREPRGVLL